MENTEFKRIQALKAHLALNVTDVERSIVFYQKMLGIVPSKVRTGYAKFDVQNPPLNLTLNQAPVEGRGALSHLGIQLTSSEDVLALRDRWNAAGLATRDEMKTDCCYATQDKTWVSDPDGNAWEAFVVLQDNLPETSNAETCCAPVAHDQAGLPAAWSCSTDASAPVVTNSCCGANAPVDITR
jgi:extradiol dioxygenase family protein